MENGEDPLGAARGTIIGVLISIVLWALIIAAALAVSDVWI